MPADQHDRREKFQKQGDANREVLHGAEVAKLRESDRDNSISQHPHRLPAGRQTDSPEQQQRGYEEDQECASDTGSDHGHGRPAQIHQRPGKGAREPKE